jgi:iron complex outermembrane receptor protein
MKRLKNLGECLGLCLLAALAARPAAADNDADNFLGGPPEVLITASRLGSGLVGSATTVITDADIAADPAAALPDILARQAGVQLQGLYGGVNGAQAAIGLRGFGATATENTLVLVNGRRVNDPDQSNIDFSAIPLSSIERIEITRGNSPAVLYGDGAVGGVINIVTKNGDNSPPYTSVDAGFGSFQYRSLDLSTNQKIGGTSLSAYGTEIVSNGYRDNNALREKNFDAELRQDIPLGQLYVNLRGDDQYLGLPGEVPAASWRTAPKSALALQDYGTLQSINGSLGGTRQLADFIELVLDAGVRHKEELTSYESFGEFYGIDITTLSLTPRFEIAMPQFGVPSKAILGVDVYQSFYRSYTATMQGAVPYDGHHLDQRTLAVYGDDSLALTADTSLGFGIRLQRADLAAREKTDAFAPGYYPGAVGTPLTQADNEYAAHLGVEQRLGAALTLFARAAHAMRMPNMDDRNYVIVTPTNFSLKTQTSDDVEIGLQANWGQFSGQTSLYAMNLHDEIDFDPGANFGLGANVNLDPTQRIGSETDFALALSSSLHLTGTVSVTRAEFRAGPYKGLEVPQVALLSGNLGGAWEIWRDYLRLDADLREIGKRRLGDDVTGIQPMVPAHGSLDMRLSGRLDAIGWSMSVTNLLDTHSFDVGYAGATPGVYSLFPLPGRALVGRLGASF